MSRMTDLVARMLANPRLARAPIWLYRARLGAVFGSRMILLEHVGRTTGARRYVVLEVVDHSSPERYVVVSGFGHRAQWPRNILANPHVRVVRGSRRPEPAIAHVLGEDDAREALRRYMDRHPQWWERFRPVVERTFGAPVDPEGALPPVVALDVTTTGGQPPGLVPPVIMHGSANWCLRPGRARGSVANPYT